MKTIDIETLKRLINGYIHKNGKQEITGDILNGVLLALADYAQNPDGSITRLEEEIQAIRGLTPEEVERLAHSLRYDVQQMLSSGEKNQARANIGAMADAVVAINKGGTGATKAQAAASNLQVLSLNNPSASISVTSDIGSLGPGSWGISQNASENPQLPMHGVPGRLDSYFLNGNSNRYQIVRYSTGEVFTRFGNNTIPAYWSDWRQEAGAVMLYVKTIEGVQYIVDAKDNVQTFHDVLALVQSENIVVKSGNVEHIPSVVFAGDPETNTLGVIEFSAIYYMYDMARLQRVIINEDDDVKVGIVEVEQTDYKSPTIESPRRPADDMHYPTTKAVKDYAATKNELAQKQDKTLVAVYDVTTYAEVMAAYNAGKDVRVEYGRRLFGISEIGETRVGFVALTEDLNFMLFVRASDNAWWGSQILFERTERRQTTITESNVNYPSSKAVADYVKGREVFVRGSGTTSVLMTATGGSAAGNFAVSIGRYTTASGNASIAIGYGLYVNHLQEAAFGTYNMPYGNKCYEYGIGTSDAYRRNAHLITGEGDHYIYGVGGYDGTNPSEAKTLQVVINELVDALESEELVIKSGTQASNKVIYDLLLANPQLAKEVVYYNTVTSTYYRLNTWKQDGAVFRFSYLREDGESLAITKFSLDATGKVS